MEFLIVSASIDIDIIPITQYYIPVNNIAYLTTRPNKPNITILELKSGTVLMVDLHISEVFRFLDNTLTS